MLFIAILFCLIPQAFAKNWTISTNTELIKYLKLASNGDNIYVKPGKYVVSGIVINKAIKLIGQNYPKLTTNGKHEIVTICSNNVVISGFNINNCGISSTEDRAGIKVINSNDVIIENNYIENNLFGIYLSNCQNCNVKNNLIIGQAINEGDSGNGIHLWHCKNIKITSNNITKHRDGIYFEFVSNSIISNNKSYNNLRYGLHFMFSNQDTYSYNSFFQNGAGVAVMYSKNVTMRNNTFTQNIGSSAYGLLLKEISNSEIVNNIIKNNTIGIQCDGTANLSVYENNFIKNGIGVRLSSYSENTKFSFNNFASNTYDVSSICVLHNNNTFAHNYFASNLGFDLNHDYIADLPFQPVKISCIIIDNNPSIAVLLNSPLFALIDCIQLMVPSLAPAELIDTTPLMKACVWEYR